MFSRAIDLLLIVTLVAGPCACREDKREKKPCAPCEKPTCSKRVQVRCEGEPAPGPAPEVVIVEKPKQRRRPKPRTTPSSRPKRPVVTRVGAGTLPLPED